MDAIDRYGQALVDAAHRDRSRWRQLRALLALRRPRGGASVNARVLIAVIAIVLATGAIALAATGVILTGSPVGTVRAPIATAGEGIPEPGGSRLLPLRAADPAGGLPWGMRVVHTTRGLVCVQIGRVDGGQLGQLGVDGAFANDGRFHPLPADALPEVLGFGSGSLAGNCASPGDTYAAESNGLELSATTNLHSSPGALSDRRQISFGLLGVHAVSIDYREGSRTSTQAVLPGLGAYLIVQRLAGSTRSSVSETDGRDEPGNYSMPAGPNGAVTAVTYRYGGRTCVDRGNLRMRSCGLSEVPAPSPAPLPAARVALHVGLRIQQHVITSAQISFRAPYAVTSADQSYSVSAQICGHELAGAASRSDVAPGGLVRIAVADILSQACSRVVAFRVEYVRFLAGLPQPTPLGSITLREPAGTHAAPLPTPLLELRRRTHPTRSLHARIQLTLLPKTRAACDAAYLLFPCYAGRIAFTAPYSIDAPGGELFEQPHYTIEGFANCSVGGRPGATDPVQRAVKADEKVVSAALEPSFVLTRRCAAHEGFEVTYINPRRSSARAPHESVIVGTATLAQARLPNGQRAEAPAR